MTNKECASKEKKRRKAVLVMDMPENCRDCPYFGFTCRLTREKGNWFNDEGRHNTCPLKELPDYIRCENTSYQNGHNELLEKILN